MVSVVSIVRNHPCYWVESQQIGLKMRLSSQDVSLHGFAAIFSRLNAVLRLRVPAKSEKSFLSAQS